VAPSGERDHTIFDSFISSLTERKLETRKRLVIETWSYKVNTISFVALCSLYVCHVPKIIH